MLINVFHRSPAGLRRASSSDTDANYGEIRFKNRHNGPPRTTLERRRYDEDKRARDSRVDSGSVDLETPQSLSPKSPLEVMLNSLTQSTGSLPRSRGDSPRKPVPQPRTKHLKKGGSVPAYVTKSADSLDLELDSYDNTESTDSSQLARSGDSHLSDEGRRSRAKDEIHDYSEIYTPSRDQTTWPAADVEANGEKPPTPPLHRFPSWESRIYQVIFVKIASFICSIDDFLHTIIGYV